MKDKWLWTRELQLNPDVGGVEHHWPQSRAHVFLKAPKHWRIQANYQLDFMEALQMQKDDELCNIGQTVE